MCVCAYGWMDGWCVCVCVYKAIKLVSNCSGMMAHITRKYFWNTNFVLSYTYVATRCLCDEPIRTNVHLISTWSKFYIWPITLPTYRPCTAVPNLVNSTMMQAADTRKSALILHCGVVLFALYRIRSLIYFSALLSYFPSSPVIYSIHVYRYIRSMLLYLLPVISATIKPSNYGAENANLNSANVHLSSWIWGGMLGLIGGCAESVS